MGLLLKNKQAEVKLHRFLQVILLKKYMAKKNVAISYQKEPGLESVKNHKKVCENHEYCYVEMPEESNKILKYNQGEKSMKVPFIIYAYLECLLEKMNTCHNNPEIINNQNK